MQAMGRVHVIPDEGVAGRPRPSSSRAWLLDADAFHTEFEDLYTDVDRSEGVTRMRWLATQVWRSADPTVHGYVDRLHTGSADEWESAYHEAHAVDWYRVLMGAHLEAVPSVSDPRTLRKGLALLGWTPSESRRAVYGRELDSLVGQYGSDRLVSDLAPHLMVDSRGWLDQDDLDHAVARLQGLDPAGFRQHQHLVPLVEELYGCLAAARRRPERVLLVLAD
jgi:hypothetical protein